jgi:hypothetical protein
MMRLFLLKTLSKKVEYDVYDAFLIRAKNEMEARQIAHENRSGEGPIWSSNAFSSCVEVSAEGDAEIIISSFNAG